MARRTRRGEKTKRIKRRVSSTDVARLAGVSQAAVSRSFTPGASVSDETRAKVLAAARELGYKPNAIARSLVMRRTNIVAAVMANLWNPFYLRFLDRVTVQLQAMGYRVLLLKIANDGETDDALVRALEYQVDGIIMTSATVSSRMADECVQRGTPVVLFNRYAVGTTANAVLCDSVAGGKMVADLLLDAGHERIAYVAGEETSSTNRDRETGFTRRLAERGYEGLIRERGDYSYRSGLAAIQRLMARDERPDAIFCANDLMAMGAIDQLRDQFGIAVPGEISIVGFDDIPMASWPHYALTTVRQPLAYLVDATIEVLLSAIEEPGRERILRMVSGEIVARRSARLPPGMVVSEP